MKEVREEPRGDPRKEFQQEGTCAKALGQDQPGVLEEQRGGVRQEQSNPRGVVPERHRAGGGGVRVSGLLEEQWHHKGQIGEATESD